MVCGIFAPSFWSSAMTLSLNCFILSDNPNQTFTVEISKAKNVSILKDLIKEKNSLSLGNVDAKNISLLQALLNLNADRPMTRVSTLVGKLD
jgi:Crinkler effector protein N-terminal domain